MTNTNNIKPTFKAPNQRVELIELEKCVPTKYQRITNDDQVEKIIESFDENRIGTLTVSLRDGNYYIVDGLHRSIALRALGYTHALCVLLTGLTYEKESALFRGQDKNKRRISSFADFKAGLEEKDEMCIKINAIVKANGFQIGSGNSFYQIGSIHALTTIAEDYGYDVLDNTLLLIAHTWSGFKKASGREFLLGIAEFVNRYGICEFSERLKEKYAVIWFDFTEALRKSANYSLCTTKSRHKFCRILVEHYNKGLRANQKAYLKWEEQTNENRNQQN